MSKKSTAAAANSEAVRIYERMEEERQRKVQTKAEANQPKVRLTRWVVRRSRFPPMATRIIAWETSMRAS